MWVNSHVTLGSVHTAVLAHTRTRTRTPAMSRFGKVDTSVTAVAFELYIGWSISFVDENKPQWTWTCPCPPKSKQHWHSISKRVRVRVWPFKKQLKKNFIFNRIRYTFHAVSNQHWHSIRVQFWRLKGQLKNYFIVNTTRYTFHTIRSLTASSRRVSVWIEP